MNPYVNISILTLVENMDRTKAVVAIKLPAIQTARQPNLFVKADTTGPVKIKNLESIILIRYTFEGEPTMQELGLENGPGVLNRQYTIAHRPYRCAH